MKSGKILKIFLFLIPYFHLLPRPEQLVHHLDCTQIPAHRAGLHVPVATVDLLCMVAKEGKSELGTNLLTAAADGLLLALNGLDRQQCKCPLCVVEPTKRGHRMTAAHGPNRTPAFCFGTRLTRREFKGSG